MERIIEKINLPLSDYRRSKECQMQLLNKCKLDLESEDTIHSQFVDLLTNQVHKEINEYENLGTTSLCLKNTFSYHENLEQSFNSSMSLFLEGIKELNSSMNAALSTSEEIVPVWNEECDVSEVSSNITNLNSLFEETKLLLKQVKDSRKELDKLKSKLIQYQVLPPNADEINQKISETKNMIDELKNALFSTCH